MECHMKLYVFDVELTVRERWRVQLEADKLPTKRKIQQMLKDEEVTDISDTETLEIESIEKVELIQEDDGNTGEVDIDDDEEDDY
jgi:hypothetical protein